MVYNSFYVKGRWTLIKPDKKKKKNVLETQERNYTVQTFELRVRWEGGGKVMAQYFFSEKSITIPKQNPARGN